MDADNSNEITLKEFKAFQSELQRWGIHLFNVAEEFSTIDFSGDGKVSFEEFAEYCIKKSFITL